MRLSICIPVYNFDVNALVIDLKKQITDNNLNVEILLIDDASNDHFLHLNAQAFSIANFTKKLEKNIGRSAIRNLFLKFDVGNYLLFLDCDGRVIKDDFLESYISEIKLSNPKVIYGGRVASKENNNPQYALRWNYATKRENLSVEQRRLKPYLSFQTNNFVIKREVLQRLQFNEKLKNYGYEDLLFSMELKDAKIDISHIDNPIFNNDIETNAVFTEKAGQSAKSLAIILKDQNTADKVSDLRIVGIYFKLKNSGFLRLFNLFFKIGKASIRQKLERGVSSLHCLDIYKLGILSEELKKG